MAQTSEDFLDRLVRINNNRCLFWHPEGVKQWSALEWAGAAAGEMGEAANVAKKLKRIDDDVTHSKPEMTRDRELLVSMLGEEIADTIIYNLLLAAREGIDVKAALRRKFNETSAKIGYTSEIL